MAVTSPTPRRIKTPSWLDLRLVLGIALVLAAVLVGAIVVSRARHTARMLAATRDLAAGTTLSADDVSFVSVQLPDGRGKRYLDDRGAAVGKQLNRPVSRGELLPAAALRTLPALTTLSVPFAAGNAPALRAGERIEVWLSTKTCGSTVLLADVTVQTVHGTSRGSFTASGGQDVVLSLPRQLADRVVRALARDDASIRAGVLTGPGRRAANEQLPDLSVCVPTPSPT